MERFELPNEHGWSWLHLAAFLVSRLSSPDGGACITAGHTGNKIHYEKHIPTLWEYGVSLQAAAASVVIYMKVRGSDHVGRRRIELH